MLMHTMLLGISYPPRFSLALRIFIVGSSSARIWDNTICDIEPTILGQVVFRQRILWREIKMSQPAFTNIFIVEMILSIKLIRLVMTSMSLALRRVLQSFL